MRLHRLRLRAFGAFAGEESIDFDLLSDFGLHLINGPTGAGKSTILDAICYALYGALPGARRRHGSSIVSDHAAAGTQPYVELDFTVSGERWRVRRTPEYQAPKKRGSGSTTRRPSVLLERNHSGTWRTLSTRVDEAGQRLGDLIGMQLDQFAQVVLLPQGQFARFLSARPEERSALLGRLFDTSRYAATEEWLVEHRKQLRDLVRRANGEARACLARAEEAVADVEVDLGDQAWSQLPIDQWPGALDDAVRTLGAAHDEALVRLEHARVPAEQAEEHLARLRRTSDLQRQARRAREALEHADAQEPERTARQDELDRAQRADLVGPYLLTWRDRAEDRSRAEAARDRQIADARHAGLVQGPDVDPGTVADLLGRLDAAGPVVQDAAAAARECRELDGRIEREETRLRALGADAEVAADAVARAGERIDRGRRRAAELHEVALLAERHARRADRAGRAQELLTRWDEAQRASAREAGEVERRKAAFASAEAALLSLRGRRLTQIASELSAGLLDGVPCPVCGSPDHPVPASAEADAVAPEDVDAAESASRAANEAVTAAQVALTASQAAADGALSRYLDLREELAQDGDELPAAEPAEIALAAAVALRRSAEADLRRAGDAAEQEARLRSRLEADEEELARHEREAQRVGQSLSGVTALLASARQESAAASTRLAELRRRHDAACPCSPAAQAEASPASTGTATDPVAVHRDTVQRLRLLGDAVRRAAEAGAQAAGARRQFDAALTAQGFTDTAELESARRSADRQQELTAWLAGHREQRDRARGVLDQEEVARACGEPEPDLVEAQRGVTEAREVLLRLDRRCDALARGRESVRRHHHRMTQALASVAQQARELEVIDSLTDTVTGTGDNTLRMRLTSYVLAARLETVTMLANEKLHTMTGGRYALEHSDALAGHGAKSGLGLRVRDAWTGRARDTDTLSGGESFMAALALALGLGDAVLQESGGRPLQTLFVDEGFGSLDQESLEQVMHVLDGLRAGGRSVGIVSHVPELRDRIPAQVLVHRGTRGSTIELIHPGRQVA